MTPGNQNPDLYVSDPYIWIRLLSVLYDGCDRANFAAV